MVTRARINRRLRRPWPPVPSDLALMVPLVLQAFFYMHGLGCPCAWPWNCVPVIISISSIMVSTPWLTINLTMVNHGLTFRLVVLYSVCLESSNLAARGAGNASSKLAKMTNKVYFLPQSGPKIYDLSFEAKGVKSHFSPLWGFCILPIPKTNPGYNYWDYLQPIDIHIAALNLLANLLVQICYLVKLLSAHHNLHSWNQK